jgi:hypothetical protein
MRNFPLALADDGRKLHSFLIWESVDESQSFFPLLVHDGILMFRVKVFRGENLMSQKLSSLLMTSAAAQFMTRRKFNLQAQKNFLLNAKFPVSSGK